LLRAVRPLNAVFGRPLNFAGFSIATQADFTDMGKRASDAAAYSSFVGRMRWKPDSILEQGQRFPEQHGWDNLIDPPCRHGAPANLISRNEARISSADAR